MVQQRLFREDLLYRLSTITVEAPPQRTRGPDVDLLAQHFVIVLNAGCTYVLGVVFRQFAPPAMWCRADVIQAHTCTTDSAVTALFENA
jgi:hypothetical protein